LELESVSIHLDQIMAKLKHGAETTISWPSIVMCSEKVLRLLRLFLSLSGLVNWSLQPPTRRELRGYYSLEPNRTICCLRYMSIESRLFPASALHFAWCLAFCFQEFYNNDRKMPPELQQGHPRRTDPRTTTPQ